MHLRPLGVGECLAIIERRNGADSRGSTDRRASATQSFRDMPETAPYGIHVRASLCARLRAASGPAGHPCGVLLGCGLCAR